MDEMNNNGVSQNAQQVQQNVQPQNISQWAEGGVQSKVNTANAFGTDVYDANTFTAAAAVKKKSPLPIIIGVGVAVLILGLAAFIWFAFFANSGNAYLTAEKQNFKVLAQSVDTAEQALSTSQQFSETVFLRPGAELAKQLGITTDLEETKLSTTIISDLKNKKLHGVFSVLAGSEEYLGLKLWEDGEKLYIQLPGNTGNTLYLNIADAENILNTQLQAYIEKSQQYQQQIESGSSFLSDSDFGDLLPGGMSAGIPNFNEIFSKLNDVGEAFSSENIKKVILLIQDAYTESLGEVKTENVKYAFEGVEVNCQKATINITRKLAQDVCLKFITKLEADNALVDAITKTGLTDKAAISAAKTYMEESIKNATKEDLEESAGYMICYIKDGAIIAREIRTANAAIAFANVNDGKNFACGMKLGMGTADPENKTINLDTDINEMKLVAKGEVNGKTYTGKIYLTSPNSTLNETDISFEFTAESETKASGKITFTATASGKELKTALEFAFEENKVSAKLSEIMDSSELFTIGFEAETKNVPEVTMPTGNMINALEQDTTALMKELDSSANGIINKVAQIIKSEKNDILTAFAGKFVESTGMTVDQFMEQIQQAGGISGFITSLITNTMPYPDTPDDPFIPVPDSSVPDSSTPESSVPDSSVPDSSDPESSYPDDTSTEPGDADMWDFMLEMIKDDDGVIHWEYLFGESLGALNWSDFLIGPDGKLIPSVMEEIENGTFDYSKLDWAAAFSDGKGGVDWLKLFGDEFSAESIKANTDKLNQLFTTNGKLDWNKIMNSDDEMYEFLEPIMVD